MWTPEQILQHTRAAQKLDQIMQAAFRFISHNRDEVNEFHVKAFIKQRLKANGLVSDKDNPIVAFGKNTSHIHYFATEKSAQKLKPGDLVMIDLWARLKEKGAPYADITWMGVNGPGLNKKQAKVFYELIAARNMGISLIHDVLDAHKIPIAGKIDSGVREFLETINLRQFFTHTTGHPLGLSSAHGKGSGIWMKNNTPLRCNMGYTIEPGLYFKDDFGMRTELDFYITPKLELYITTPPQKEIVLL